MQLTEYKSRAELSTFIESYWQFNSDAKDELIFVPDGTFNVFFSFHPFMVTNEKKMYPEGVYLLPITDKPISLVSCCAIYGVRFKAFSLANIIGQQGYDLAQVNNVNDLIDNPAYLKEFSELLRKEEDPNLINVLLEEVSYELLSKHLSVDVHTRDKVNYILDQRGQIRVADMAKDFGVSRQGLHKSFKQKLLISPKDLSSIWQLNHFFTLLDEKKDSLTGLAIDAGYYDQAHFIHTFKEKFGLAPSQFIKSNAQIFNFVVDNMSKRFTNYYDPEI